MYNRYIPQPDGSFRRSRVQEPNRPQPQKPPVQAEQSSQTVQSEKPAHACPPQAPQSPPPKQTHNGRQERCPKLRKEPQPAATDLGSFFKNLLPKDFDTSDLLIVVLLLLMAGDCQEEENTALLTLALYLFL